jgi:hypothetical protein
MIVNHIPDTEKLADICVHLFTGSASESLQAKESVNRTEGFRPDTRAIQPASISVGPETDIMRLISCLLTVTNVFVAT